MDSMLQVKQLAQIYEVNRKLSQEIKDQKVTGKTYLAQFSHRIC